MNSRAQQPLCTVLTGLALLASALGAQTPSGSTATPARFKAIFEPVSYPQDLELTDIVFVNDSVGWASGAAGTILNTRNGGKTWTAQLGGDPRGAGRPIAELRFLSDKVGFAAQSTDGGDHRLYQTTDGETWSESGTVGQHRGDFQFTSAENGVYLYGKEIFHTTDGGKNWKSVYSCDISVVVQGLTRNAACHLESVHFPAPQIGYSVSRNLENAAFVIAKTTNGGADWTAWAVPDPAASAEYIVFTDENTGFIKMWGGKIYSTRDGGKTWAGVAGATLEGGKAAKVKFVDREVGWGMSPYGSLIYTVDGGKRWMSRKLQFPAGINGFTLTSRRRGYVAGEHGMVYRYSIVPIGHKAANMIEAPAMPAGSAR
ncbi:MAG: hypothetical protein H8F28_15320 [Fibrella sp.]|nr:hypothetical protein [Armatimonadota bacterium]